MASDSTSLRPAPVTGQQRLFGDLPDRVVPSEMPPGDFARWLYAWKAHGALRIMVAVDESDAYVVR